ncbi:alpha/beta hydrolase [Streptomyces sp. NBC_00028]|uniref:alpha/beta hydrolase n=1 Tax=Streptomyces sp. NBC_00028 TaxID=2975624 RepID=UPI00386E74E8
MSAQPAGSRAAGAARVGAGGPPSGGGTPQARASETPPPASPPRRTHTRRRATLATLITAAVVLPLSAAARPEIPAPAPATLPHLTVSTLDKAYAANRENAAEASRMAAAHGDTHRATADRALATPTHHLLHFDGRGEGQATEVFGDLAHAEHIAVLVPGSDTSLDTYARFRADATALRGELHHTEPRTAVITWLGYKTPDTISTTVTTTGRADQAAPHLRQFIRQLRGIVGPTPTVSLLCHSYGSVVCARAASHLDATDLVLLGSPGTGEDTAAALHARARVWVGRGSDDWVAEVPHIKTDLFGTTVGFGTDPMSPSFGANRFAAGDGGHSDYFDPGSVSLTNLARIVLGRTSEVTHA